MTKFESRPNASMLALLAMVMAATASAQTRDYNPIRRTSGTQELTLPAGAASTVPAGSKADAWTPPPMSGPPGQWRSVRQPGPVQLPAPNYLPSRATMQPQPAAEETVPPAPMPADAMAGEGYEEGPWTDGPSCDGPGCGEGCGGCGDEGCGDCCGCTGRSFGLCGGTCGGHFGHAGHLRHLIPKSWQLYGGVQGFKGPPDRGNNGNFGFQEGFNLGGVKPLLGLGYQIGGRFVQSNLSGSNAAVQTTAGRDQSFFTAGLFHRVPNGCGLQGGVVWDILSDDYYVDMTLTQIRGEISFVGPCFREIGFMFAASTDDDTDILFNNEEIWEPTDQYAFFYRSQIGCGGQWRVWGGWTGASDAIIGGELNVPLTDCLALTTSFNYLIPDENGVASIDQEAWNLGTNIVWYLGGGARCPTSICRPLFNVADNGSFMVDRFQRARPN